MALCIADRRFFVTESFYQSSVKILLNAIGASPGRMTYVPNLNVAWQMASKGIGIAFIMQSMLRHKHLTPAPDYCMLDAPESTLHYTLSYRKTTLAGNPLLMRFIEHCQNSFQDKVF